ncbi:hypothetical protein MRX96_043243 [Rhipicephalus microplus]
MSREMELDVEDTGGYTKRKARRRRGRGEPRMLAEVTQVRTASPAGLRRLGTASRCTPRGCRKGAWAAAAGGKSRSARGVMNNVPRSAATWGVARRSSLEASESALAVRRAGLCVEATAGRTFL